MTASWTFWVALALIRIECEAIMYEPNFVSDWYPLAAGTNETLKIYHNLGDTPVKVDIQVKINESGEDYIFSGLGSSQRDDDTSTFPIGGVVYKYNHAYVQLGVPYRSNTAATAPKGLTYTGSDDLYYGPTNICGPYLTGHVRARMWLEINMPTKVYETSVYMSNNEGETYQEIPHNLGYYPDMVTVQTRLGTTRFMSDGVGAMFLSNTSGYYNSIGGVLFGYDDTKIRLWVPSKFGNHSSKSAGGVFAATDGYILGLYRDGEVNIAAWKIDCSQQVLHKTFSVGGGVTHPSVIEFPCAYTLHNYLVSVQLMVPLADGPNGGMLFYGVGTTQAINWFNYGGIVYAYNDAKVLFWLPKSKPVISIEDRWGSGYSSQVSMTADIVIRVFYLPESECPDAETISNSAQNVTGTSYADTITYECSTGYKHRGGDLTRTCGRDRLWSGIPPVCTIISCPVPESVLNGYYISSAGTGALYLPGYVVTYICFNDHILTGGPTSRTCQSNELWTDTAPVCTATGCPMPDHVDNASNTTSTVLLYTSLYSVGTTITYACDTGYEMTAGSSSRTCQSNGYWDELPPACTIINCHVPDLIGNGSYTPTSTVYLPLSIITYQCDPGCTLSGGSASRTCNSSGSWDGVPAFCTVISCPAPDPVGNGSYLPTSDVYLPGTIITYSCNPGLSITSGSVSRTCDSSGSWDGLPATCTGYDITAGSSSRTCQNNGYWDELPPACTIISCLAPDPVGNGSYLPTSDTYLPGSKITYNCNLWLSITSGSVSRRCDSSGSWDGFPAICTAVGCPLPDYVDNASNTTSTMILLTSLYSVGTIITYVCDAGYTMSYGSPSRTCQSSSHWDQIPPACTIINCPAPEPIGNGSYTPISAIYLPGSVITYNCNPGFGITGGSASRTCESSGSWDGFPAACTACTTSSSVSTNVGDEDIQGMIQTMRVDKKSTSSYVRSLNSAYDGRKSAQILGLGGVVLLCIVCCFFILPDICRVLKHFKATEK